MILNFCNENKINCEMAYNPLFQIFLFLHLSMNISGFNQKRLIKDSCRWFIFRDSVFFVRVTVHLFCDITDMSYYDDQSVEWAWMSQRSPKGFDYMTGQTWIQVPNHCIQWLFSSQKTWLTETKLNKHKWDPAYGSRTANLMDLW